MEESSALAACAEVSALTSVSRLTFHHLLSSCKPLFSVSVDVAAAFCKTVGDACAVRSQNRMAAGDPIVRECVGLMIAHPGCMEVEEGAIRALGFLSSAHPPVVLGLLRSQPPAVVPALTCCALLESLTFPSPSDFDAAVDACAPFLDSPDVDLAYCAALVGSCAGRAENKLAATERSVRLAVTILSSCSDRNVSLHAIRAVGLLCSPTRDGVEGVYLPPLCASAVSSLLPCFAVGVEECEAVCEAVAAVASGTNGCEELVKAGVLPRVFAAMDAWPANDRVQAGSCLLLARVCKQTSSGRYSVVAHGGLGRVYSGLQACAASAPVQLAGLEALAELCCEEDCTLTFLRSNGVDSVVYPAMDAHLQSIPVQQAACRVLDRVANTAEGLRVLGEGRGLEVLKRVRQVHPRHKVMHTGASPVIAKLLASK